MMKRTVKTMSNAELRLREAYSRHMQVFKMMYNDLLGVYDTLSSEEQKAFDIGELFGMVKVIASGVYKEDEPTNPTGDGSEMQEAVENEPDTV